MSVPEKFTVAASPHIRSDESVRSVMGDVVIALVPVMIMATYLFGLKALALIATAVASCLLFEFLYTRLMKKETSIGDLSAVVTGVLLAFNLPVSAPIWLAAVGSFFAIVIVKMLFGGLGCNFLNPALAARVFLFASWPSYMTKWTLPTLLGGVDAATTATPLSLLKQGELPGESILQLLIGYRGGCIGETAALLLIAGGLYLLYRKVITWHIPVAFVGTVAAITFLFPLSPDRLAFMYSQLLSGGLLLGAIFMATDYVTSPVNPGGKLIYGVGCGLITVFIRYFGGYSEGVSFAILLMNTLAFQIDKITRGGKFGGGVKNA